MRDPLLNVPKAEAYAAWKSVTFRDRLSVIRLAKAGEQHPDPRVRVAAYLISHDEQLNRLWGPAWLLPLVSAILIVLTIALRLPIVFPILMCALLLTSLYIWDYDRDCVITRRVYPLPEAPADIAEVPDARSAIAPPPATTNGWTTPS